MDLNTGKLNVKDLTMNKDVAKVFAMFALGLGSFLFGILPACISRRKPLLISFLLCFGGGVLLSTSIVHMLPEVREDMPEYAEIVFCIGFFIIYIIDELVHLCGHGHSHGGNDSVYGANDETQSLLNPKSEMDRPPPYNPEIAGSSRSSNVNVTAALTADQSHVASVFGLLCALCVHSFLEGLAIGVQNSGAKVLLLVAAVASHKFVVGFCLGVELRANPANRARSNIIQILIFSMGSVAGIGIGMCLDDFDASWSNIVMPVLQGLAGGTLLYVTVCEVLPREKAKWHNHQTIRTAGILQLLAVILGFTIMSVLNFYLGG